MRKLITIAAVVILAGACLAKHPALALTPSGELLAQAVQTPTTAPKAPTVTPPKAPEAAPSAPQTPAASATLIDINSANEAELQTLSGIGPARAQAIIAGRPYKGKDDLVNKGVIPSNVYQGIRDKIIARQK